MLFLVGDSNGNFTVCYPIYLLHNFKALAFPWSLLLVTELVLHVISMFWVFKCIYITITVRTFHTNMSILVVGFASQWFEVVVANAMSWPYETGFWQLRGVDRTVKQWWTDEESEMVRIASVHDDFLFFLAGFIKLHYLVSMANILLIISVERAFACFYLNDYEQKSRVWIAFMIISINQVSNLIVAYLIYFKFLHFIMVMVVNMIPNIIGLLLIFGFRRYNLKVTRTIATFESPYTLAARFQANENVRCFQMIRLALLSGVCIVCLGFSTAITLYLDVLPALDTLLNILIQSAMCLAPLAVCPSMIHAVDSWRRFRFFEWSSVLRKLKVGTSQHVSTIPHRKGSELKIEMVRKETDAYFNQLSASWA